MLNINKMNAKQYQLNRNELLNLMEQVITVEGIRDNERESFLSTQRKLVENQFNIVLIGEFQGGKSTTFNAMCGGREISPRGAMTKTSAICMTATNISDPSQEEYAEVRWKSNSELRDMINEVVKFVSVDDGVGFDFSNPSHMKNLRDQVEIMKKSGTIEVKEILRIAQLLYAFYGNTELKKYYSKDRFMIDEIAKIAVFPSDWESRWSEVHSIDDVKRLFDVEEILFAFVSDIQIHVHSDSLARLGCSLTDCPGLFASQFDTQVAINAMTRANAVIYLLGNKAIGDSDKKSITEVMRHKALRDKVFFALNQKEKNIVTEGVIKADKSAIKDLGFGDVEITNFNSLLFFLSEFGKAKISGKIDNYSLLRFREVAANNGYELIRKENNVDIEIPTEDVWAEITRTCGITTGLKDVGKIVGLDDESVNITRSASGCDNVIGGIENDIVSQKAQSILIDSGAALIKNSLDGIAARLQTEEDLANKSVEECEIEFQEAMNAYELFKNEVDEILSNAFPKNVIDSVALSAYTELITDSDVVDRMAARISNDIDTTLSFWDKAKLKFISDDEKKALFEPIIKNAIDMELGNDINIWVNSMTKGDHEMFKGMIQPQLESVAMKINLKWEMCVTSNPLLQGYKVDTPSLNCPSDFISEAKDDLVRKLDDATMASAMNDIIDIIVYAVAGAIAGAILAWLTGSVIFILVYAIVGGLLGTGEDNNCYQQIKDNLKDKFSDKKTKEEIISGIANCPWSIFDSFKKFYRGELSTMQHNLENDIEKKRTEQADSVNHQQEVALRARRIRTEQIEPLRNKIVAFIKACDC